MSPLIKQQRHQSKKLRESARGQDCTVRIPGVCNHNPETTVLAHLNGSGMGTKASDLHAAFACYACHLVLDGHSNNRGGFSKEQIELMHRQGVQRTQQFWLDNGYLELP